jgi:hypothetical protein
MIERVADQDDGDWIVSARLYQYFGGVSSNTVHRWRNDPALGFPEPIKVQGRNYWRPEDLRRWRREQAQKTLARASGADAA